jgi:hypothetical protein
MTYIPPTRFYIYGITIDGKVCYIGKGSDRGRHSRIMQYFEESLAHVTEYAREKLKEARRRNAEISHILFEEFPIPSTATYAEVLSMQAVAHRAEARWIKQHGGPDLLWNKTHGGRSGTTASNETRKKMSESQKRRGPRPPPSKEAREAMSKAKIGKLISDAHKMHIGLAIKLKREDEEFRQRQKDGIQRARDNGTHGRPRGYTVSVEEARILGCPAGKAELTLDQKNELRRYRYAHARKVL